MFTLVALLNQCSQSFTRARMLWKSSLWKALWGHCHRRLKTKIKFSIFRQLQLYGTFQGLLQPFHYVLSTFVQNLSFLPVSSLRTTIWHHQSAEKWQAEWINLESEVIRICDAQWSSNLLHSWNDGNLSFQPVQWTHTSIISISWDSSLWTKKERKDVSPRYRSAKSCTLANFSKTYGMSAAHIMLEAEIIYREGTASESEIMKVWKYWITK